MYHTENVCLTLFPLPNIRGFISKNCNKLYHLLQMIAFASAQKASLDEKEICFNGYTTKCSKQDKQSKSESQVANDLDVGQSAVLGNNMEKIRMSHTY